jgi:carbamoyl-phosphate synthase large subunit
MTPIRCLITGAAGDIGQSIGTILHESALVDSTVGADMRSDHPGPAFFDDCVQLPAATNPAYGPALLNALKEHEIDALFPTSEAELCALLDPILRDALPDTLRIVAVNRTALEIGLDKLATANCLRTAGLGAPWTQCCGDGLPPTLPCIVKPRHGQGSKGLAIIHSMAEAELAVQSRADEIFQELLLPDDAEYTCALFRSTAGEIRTLVLHRVLANGFSVRGSVADPSPYLELLKGIAIELDLVGSINVQCRLTKQGPKVFEINSRFSSTVEMRHRMGFTDVIWALEDLFNLPISGYAPPQLGQRFYRASRAIILPPKGRDDVGIAKYPTTKETAINA